MKAKRIVIYFLLVIIMVAYNFYLRPIKGNNLVNSEYKQSEAYINDLYMSDEHFKHSVLAPDEYYIYDEIIKGTKDDLSSVKIFCDKDNCIDLFQKAYYAIYLDHPELISFLGIRTYSYENNYLSYYNYENNGKLKSYLGARRIAREMEIVRKETKDMDEKEKILYVYNYVGSHNYDKLFMITGPNQSAYSFFTKGSSVCAGFAKAAQITFQNIGINSYVVTSGTHMWNYVEYQGKYYIFDATMGASYRDKSSTYYYDGLGETTSEEVTGVFSEYYPQIEVNTKLKDLFDV